MEAQESRSGMRLEEALKKLSEVFSLRKKDKGYASSEDSEYIFSVNYSAPGLFMTKGKAVGGMVFADLNSALEYLGKTHSEMLRTDTWKITYGSIWEEADTENSEKKTDTTAGLPENAKHYQLGSKQAIELMQERFPREYVEGFCICNVMKYALRLGAKDELPKEVGKIKTYSEWYLKLVAGETIVPIKADAEEIAPEVCD